MADRYWRGLASDLWDATAGTKWADTVGGAGGAAVPTAADDVYFDGTSATCTISGARVAKSINCTGYTATLAGASTPSLTISGSLTLAAGMTLTYAGTTTFNATGTITSAGKTLGPVTINGSGITVTLGDAFVSSGALTVTQGTFNTANFNVTATQLSSSNSNLRTITLGSSTITLSAAAAVALNTNTNLTFNSGTSTITCSATNVTLNGGATSATGVTFYNVSFTATAVSTHNIQSINTFNNLAVTAPAAAGFTQVTFDSRQTINGTLSTSSTAGNRRVWFRGVTYGVAQTLTVNATPSLTDADFRDLYITGTAAPISGTRIGNLRGCSGITFSTPKTVYWNLAGAQNWSADGWSDTSTGTPNTNFFPLAQDTATFTNSGAVTGTITMNSAIPYTGTVDMSGRTSAMTLSLGAAQTIYGDWKNGSGTTLSGAQTLTFSGRDTQAITSAGKTFSGGIVLDTYGGTVELVDAFNIGANVLTVTNGTFDTKNYNVTAGAISSNNSNVRAMNLGSSTVTLSSTTPIIFTDGTNLTLSGSYQINMSATGITFAGGGRTFNNVTFTGSIATTHSITGVNTFNNLTFTAAAAGFMTVSFGADQTITGTLTCSGANAIRRIQVVTPTVLGDPYFVSRTLTVGTLVANDCNFQNIVLAGAAVGTAPTRAGDLEGNSGITFSAPKTVYWNLSGTQNWDAIAWAPTSGGTPNIDNFPLPQDTAVFDDLGNAGTISLSIPGHLGSPQSIIVGTIDMSNRTNAMTLTIPGVTYPSIIGDFKLGTGVTFNNGPGTGAYTFAKRGVQTITSNGVQLATGISIFGIGGTVQLADAFSSTGGISLGAGVFDAVSYNVTISGFSMISGYTRTLRMGSGLWTLTGTGNAWDGSSANNGSIIANTANILFSNTTTTNRTFAGGGFSYNKLTIGGTTGISTTTITGNNFFTELASTKTVAHTIALGTTAQTFGKWTVTGTVGNVVTLTGTGTSHSLAGACTSGIDYLAMGSIGFAATSPGEFYAGANSTATAAAAPVYLTAKPADSTRYWVGGTGNWSDTARWSTGSGGASGASVPRSHDDVVFDAASNATAYTATVNAVTGGIRMKSLTIAGPTSGNVTLAGSTAIDGIHGNVTLPATGLTRTYTGAITLSGSTTGKTLTTNGVALSSAITINGEGCGVVLGSALDNGTSNITVTNGTLDFATYNVTAAIILSNTANLRTINFGSGTITLSGSTPISFSTTEKERANLTVTAGTAQINCSNTNPTFTGNNKTFYNVSFTSTSAGTVTINGINSFNNLSYTGITAAGYKNIALSANQTVTGTLTFSAGTNATMRHFCRSNTIGTTRTITAAAVSMTDVDFRDITIAGAAAPASGTRIGNIKGNSGITFDAAKTVYWNLAGAQNWEATGWATTQTGSPAANNFPLAQDTATFTNAGSVTGTITLGNWFVGTIDMSGRTNAMTLSTTTPTILGNWINGAGTTLSGTSAITFAGRTTQQITSAGKTWTQAIIIDSIGGLVVLQDNFSANQSVAGVLTITNGTFDAATYNVSLSGAASSLSSSNSNTRTIAVGSGTWTITGTGGWDTSTSTNLTVTGTGTITFPSASAKTFAGGGVAYTDITLNQGGAGTLSITGNNTFKDITNSYKATGATTIAMGTTTQRVSQFTAAGEASRVLTITGTSSASPATLVYTGASTISSDYLTITGIRAYPTSTTWYAGANSTNNGSLGWTFTAATPSTVTYNFFLLFN